MRSGMEGDMDEKRETVEKRRAIERWENEGGTVSHVLSGLPGGRMESVSNEIQRQQGSCAGCP